MSLLNVDTVEPEGATTDLTLGAGGDKVVIPGTIKISGGSPGADKLLTSDADGDATWVAAAASGLFSGYAVFQDQKTVGTDGGTFTSGAWRTRVLNATVFNTDTTNISLGTDQFTLLTGSYLIEWSAPAYEVNSHQARLFDVTGGSWFQNGTSEYAHETTPISTRSFGSVRVTVAASPGTNIYSVEHRAETTKATLGFGLENNFSAGPEVYTTVIIYKES